MIELKVFYKDIASVTEEQYALLRKDTFGASDLAGLFGVGFQTADEIIAQKQIKSITDEERAIGQKPNVKKGKDLEPLILEKYRQHTKLDVIKPPDMYEIIPGLTVNFDAICQSLNIPVEIKYVSAFGGKYWSRSVETIIAPESVTLNTFSDIADYIRQKAGHYGIPPYYYTQLQAQILGLNAEYGELGALFDKDWELQIYRVHKDPYLHSRILQIIPKHYESLMGVPAAKTATVVPDDFDY
jgi:hypothetical protein